MNHPARVTGSPRGSICMGKTARLESGHDIQQAAACWDGLAVDVTLECTRLRGRRDVRGDRDHIDLGHRDGGRIGIARRVNTQTRLTATPARLTVCGLRTLGLIHNTDPPAWLPAVKSLYLMHVSVVPGMLVVNGRMQPLYVEPLVTDRQDHQILVGLQAHALEACETRP